MAESKITNVLKNTDVSSSFSSSAYSQLYYAVKIGNMVFFSVATNAITLSSADNEYVKSLVTGAEAKPKSTLALSIASGTVYTPKDVIALLRNNGELVIRTGTAMTNKSFIVSGAYVTSGGVTRKCKVTPLFRNFERRCA